MFLLSLVLQMIYEQTIIHDHHINFEIKVLSCAIRWGSLQGMVND